jgi:hypothetical protein
MAFTKTPTSWLTSWAEDGTNITVPIASIPELTAAEADAATGDIRKILWALSEKMWQRWDALVTADKPANMTIRKFSRIDPSTSEVTSTYTFEFVLTPGSFEVTDEPV